MSLPPGRGSVIRYAYLWADESVAGRKGAEGSPRSRACLSVKKEDGSTQLLVLAVTHAARADLEGAVPIPQEVKRRIGLDDAPAWIVTTEANAFVWLGPDIRPVPGRRPRTVVYGRVPDSLLRQVARSFLANRDRQRSQLVRRTQ